MKDNKQKISEIREIQEIEIGILRHFKSICEQNGLTYFLSNGTLLGAVKYKKFIPWDDDIDVFMPRSDYDKLMHIAEADTAVYKLFSVERDVRWRMPFAKMCDMRTRKTEGDYTFGAEIGLDIDIFPLDVWSGNENQAAYCGLLRRCLAASNQEQFSTPKGGVQKAILYVIWKVSRGIGTSFFQKRLEKEVNKGRNTTNPKYLGSVAWSLYGAKEFIRAEVFAKCVPVEFEGDIYSAPVGYDEYLRQLYGDYHEDPPIEKQVTHHFFEAFYI